MKLQLTLAILVVVALGVTVAYLEANPTGSVVQEPQLPSSPQPPAVRQEQVIDMKPDLIDKNLGTVVIETNVDLSDKKEGIVEFFSSKRVKGLWIRYRLSDKRLMGGLPVLVSGTENLLDGKTHMLAYTFKRGEGQALVFDGKVVAQGAFTGVAESLPTGMVVSYPPEKIEAEIKVYPKVLYLNWTTE